MSDEESESKGRLRTIRFIEAIRSHRCLWDSDDKHYRSTNNKEYIWTEIAKEHGYSNSAQARIAWKRLRDIHRHSVKRRRYRSLEPWKYESQMEFLLPHTTRRKKNDQYDRQYGPQGWSSMELSWQDDEPSKKKKKSKKTGHLQPLPVETVTAPEILKIPNLEDSTHTDNLKRFFDTMYENTKVLPVLMQLEVKHNIFEIVSKAEKGYYTLMKDGNLSIIGPDRDQDAGSSKAERSNIERLNVIEGGISKDVACVFIKSEQTSDDSD